MWLQKFDKKLTADSYVILPLLYVVARTVLIGAVQPERSPQYCVTGPFDGCGFIFDEAHYIPAVRKMLSGEAVNLEHPPLTKWIIMLGMYLFGDNPWGWRLPIVFFSALRVALVGLLAKRVGGDKYIIPAQLLMFTDVTFFNLRGVGILDPPALFFMVLSVYFYTAGRKLHAGIVGGLLMLLKTMVSPGGI